MIYMRREQLADKAYLLIGFIISNKQVIIALDFSVSVDPDLDQTKQHKDKKEEAVS